MTLNELKELIDRQINHLGNGEDIRVGIVVKTVGSTGGTPLVNIKTVQAGIDWDKGKFMIFPEKDLRSIEADELARLRKESEDRGWAEYENRILKAENKKLKKQLQLKVEE